MLDFGRRKKQAGAYEGGNVCKQYAALNPVQVHEISSRLQI